MEKHLSLAGMLLLAGCLSASPSSSVNLDKTCNFVIPSSYRLVSDSGDTETYYQDDPVAYIRVRTPINQMMVSSVVKDHRRQWATKEVEKYTRINQPIGAEDVVLVSPSVVIAVIGPDSARVEALLSGCSLPGR